MSPAKRVLLVGPYPAGHWHSITNYTSSIAGLSASGGVTFEAASGPWWRPPLVGALLGRVRRQPTMLPNAAGAFEVVHITDQGLGHHVTRFPGTPVVVTCHDLMPFTLARGRGASLRRWLLRAPVAGMLLADHVIAVSEASRRDFEGVLGLDPAKISVVPAMVDGRFQPCAGSEEWLESHGFKLPPGPRILSVGSTGGYKNLELLIAAMAAPALRDASLVRVGMPLTRRHRAQAASLGVTGRIVELGTISDAAVVRVYNACSVLAQPSLFEGFGMPVVEAMASGLPVVCTDGGALPEVAGDAAIVVPLGRGSASGTPAPVSQFSESLARVLDDAGLAATLRTAGLRRAEGYRPAAVLPALLAAYERTVAAARE